MRKIKVTITDKDGVLLDNVELIVGAKTTEIAFRIVPPGVACRHDENSLSIGIGHLPEKSCARCGHEFIPPTKEADKCAYCSDRYLAQYACCHSAYPVQCVCTYSTGCPEHGLRHHGTHD